MTGLEKLILVISLHVDADLFMWYIAPIPIDNEYFLLLCLCGMGKVHNYQPPK